MIILVAVVVGITIAALAAGRPQALADVRLRGIWLLLLAFAIQFTVIVLVPNGPRPVLELIHVLTYVGPGAFIWLNRSVPGLVIAGTGGALNALAITLNGGIMPASERAVRGAGLPLEPQQFLNSGILPDPALPWLGDVLWVPSTVPLANVFSIGDVIMVVAVISGVFRLCRRGSTAVSTTVIPVQRNDVALGRGRAAAEGRA